MKISKKYKNAGLWVALISAIIVFVQSLAVAFEFPLPENLEAKTMGVTLALLTVLNVLGIVSNPKDGKWFKDKE